MKFYLIILGIVLILGGAVFAYSYKNPSSGEDIVACTMEAKICPDGSAVLRTGPKCEFSPCPTPSTTIPPTNSVTTAGLNQRIFNNGVFITPLEVSDSRCPIDVTCVWAGEFSLRVKLEKGSVSKEVEMKEGVAVVFQGYSITLVGVAPKNSSKKPISVGDYRFTFRVTSINEQGTISGKVTTSPTCPVERDPPDPNCAPKPYETTITIKQGSKTIKTIKNDSSGVFSTSLPAGSYVLEAMGAPVFPRCSSVEVQVFQNKNTIADISCDSGIR